MPIDMERALGAELAETSFAWDEDRVILYHLGVGAGDPPTDPGELAYTYEANLKVLPTFATIPPFTSMLGIGSVEGLDFNPAMLLHGEQDLTLAGPIPTGAMVVNRGRIAEIWDKGKAALVVVEVTTVDGRNGEELFTNRSSLFLRGEGGFGGEAGPSTGIPTPDRSPTTRFAPRRCPTRHSCTGCRETRTPSTPTRPSPRWAASTVPSCTVSAPTGSSARRWSMPPSPATSARWPGTGPGSPGWCSPARRS